VFIECTGRYLGDFVRNVIADDFALSRGSQGVLNIFESGGTGNPSVLDLEWHLSAFIKMVSFSGHERESTRINV
jgi:hypothetical protein